MIDSLTKHWFATTQGWSVSTTSENFFYSDLVATNSGGDCYIVCVADGSDPIDAICQAIGRLTMMMHRHIATNSLGLPERDPSLDPPLVRYILAVPNSEKWLFAARKIPERIRRMLNLVVATVDDNEVRQYVEGVAI